MAPPYVEAELKEVQDVRKDGYAPGSVEVAVHRGQPVPRDERIRIPYEIEIFDGGRQAGAGRGCLVLLIHGAWKVVRVGVKSRDVTPAP